MLMPQTINEYTINKDDKDDKELDKGNINYGYDYISYVEQFTSAAKDDQSKLLNYITFLLNKNKQNRIIFKKPSILDASIIKDFVFSVDNQSNIQITQNRLLELLREEDEDEDLLKPTNYAFDKAWNLVENASKVLKKKFPKAWVSTDGEGGIRLTWSKLQSEAEVRLICGATPEKRTYIYNEQGAKYGVIEQVSASSLSQWLTWLNQV